MEQSFLQSFLTDLQSSGRKPSTIKRYEYDLKDFERWLLNKRKSDEDLDWQTIEQEEIEQYMIELSAVRQYRPSTIRRIYSALKKLAEYERENGSQHLAAVFLINPPVLKIEKLERNEWVTKKEYDTLLNSVLHDQYLSDEQLTQFDNYKERNALIIKLIASYGLTIQQVQSLSIDQVNFAKREIYIKNDHSQQRIIQLTEEDHELAYTYYTKIKEPVRPRLHYDDPFFVAFDFKRKTYHWSYDQDEPKRLSLIAMQKMIRLEVSRAQLRKGISAQTLRNTFILKLLLKGKSTAEILSSCNLTSELSLRKYVETIIHMSEKEKEQLFQ